MLRTFVILLFVVGSINGTSTTFGGSSATTKRTSAASQIGGTPASQIGRKPATKIGGTPASQIGRKPATKIGGTPASQIGGKPATLAGARAATRVTAEAASTSPLLACYVCGGLNAPCPKSFPSNGGGVNAPTVRGPAYCGKLLPGKSTSNPPMRFVDYAIQCTSNGCRSYGGDTLCCCDHDRCNTGLLSSQITFSLMFVALTFLAFFR